jgi:phosphoglycerate dehydrogenase-like enzyme
VKTIFLNGDPVLIRRVFDDSVRETLGTPDIVAPKELERRDLRGVEVIFSTWGMPQLSEAEIAARFPALKAVFYGAGTVQDFARPFLRRGVKVFSAWGANAVPVAEFTVAQIVLANKGFFQSAAMLSPQAWDAARGCAEGCPGNWNAKVGLIGCGMIGKLVAKLLQSYRLEVLAFDPYLSHAQAGGLGVAKCALEPLFAQCQTISNHLANNEQTKGILHYGLFSRMKPNATFINTGRGAQVVEADLIRALKEEPGRTALLDVTEPEPPGPGSELYTLQNVILTPHIAGSMGLEVARMGEYMASEFEAWLHGRATRYEVTMEMLETMA